MLNPVRKIERIVASNTRHCFSPDCGASHPMARFSPELNWTQQINEAHARIF